MKKLALFLFSIFALSEVLIIQNVFASSNNNHLHNNTNQQQRQSSNNHLHNNNSNHIKTSTTIIDAGHTHADSKSNSNSSSGAYNYSPNKAKSKSNSGGNTLKTEDNSESKFYAPAHMNTGGATHGVNLGVGGFQWKSLKGKAYTGGFLTKAQKLENYCIVTLSRSQARELPMCKDALKESRKLVASQPEDSFGDRDDH